MVEMRKPEGTSRQAKNDALFRRACELWEHQEWRAAFRGFLNAAKRGDRDSQLNLGYCYDTGNGTRRNLSAALYWYKRAYRRRDGSAANNIGTIWRDRRNPKRALYWFRRAVKLGDEGAYLEIAKLYLQTWHDPEKAISCLKRVCRSQKESEATVEEALRLLKLTRSAFKRSWIKATIAG